MFIPLRDNLTCTKFAWMTFLLIALNCVVFGFGLSLDEAGAKNFETWAFSPTAFADSVMHGDLPGIVHSTLTLFTSMFMHGGWMHLIGNMIFLQAFGRAVESRFGVLWYLFFYLTGGVAACFAQGILAPPEAMIGASGAIAGVLGAYLIFYPQAKMRTLLFIPIPLFVTVKAYWMILFWFVMQILPATAATLSPDADHDNVAYWAHVGGFLAGMLAAYYWTKFYPVSIVCEPQPSSDCSCPGDGSKK